MFVWICDMLCSLSVAVHRRCHGSYWHGTELDDECHCSQYLHHSSSFQLLQRRQSVSNSWLVGLHELCAFGPLSLYDTVIFLSISLVAFPPWKIVPLLLYTSIRVQNAEIPYILVKVVENTTKNLSSLPTHPLLLECQAKIYPNVIASMYCVNPYSTSLTDCVPPPPQVCGVLSRLWLYHRGPSPVSRRRLSLGGPDHGRHQGRAGVWTRGRDSTQVPNSSAARRLCSGALPLTVSTEHFIHGYIYMYTIYM